MATVIGILWNERDGQATADYRRSYRVSYLVRTAADEGQQAAMAAPGMLGTPQTLTVPYVSPIAGKTLARAAETDPNTLAKSITCKQWESHPDLWAVTVEYSSDCPDPDLQANDPRERKSRKRCWFERYKEGMEYDLNGFAIRNSADSPFDAVETDNVQLVIEISKNLAEYDHNAIYFFLDRVNTDAFLGFDIGVLKVHDVASNGSEFENGIVYWPTKLVLHARWFINQVNLVTGLTNPYPWRLYKLDCGFEYKYTDPVTLQVGRRRFTDALTNQPLSKPGLLNGNGGQLAIGDPAVYIEFKQFPEATYAPLAALFLP